MKIGSNIYKGLTSDISSDLIKNGFYIDALDIRITTDEGDSNGAITNIKGNKLYFQLPTTDADLTVNGTIEIIGATSIRNHIILFLTDDSNINGWLYSFEYNDIDQSLIGSLTLRYKSSELNFSKNRPIKAIGRYESDCIQRVYWSDYNEYFRSVNIVDPDLLNTPVGLIDIFPNVNYVQPLLTSVTSGGSILSGNHQYAYRLITFDGKETLISPPSIMIHATIDNETNSQSSQYNGNLEATNTFKSHHITIDTSNYSNFQFIELIHIYHENLIDTPQIFSVETKEINNLNTITFVHTGSENTISELDLFEYTLKQNPFQTVKTMVPKDNSLIVANIKGNQFDIQSILTELNETFDAKTKRYDRNQNEDVSLTNDLEKAFNSNYNKDAHWEANWHKNEQYKYKSDGLRLGGEGPNISYTFHLEEYFIDGNYSSNISTLANSPTNFPDLQDGYGAYINTTFDGVISPFRSGLLKGYKRGETYRFGIIFYNKKGEPSFVEYIGDIKFPDISDNDSVTNNSGTNYFPVSRETLRNAPNQIITSAYSLGIQFSIDFSTCPNFLNQIESYQIVRVKRESFDSRRLCSGIMKVGMKFDILTDDGDGDNNSEYDLQVAGGEDVVHLFTQQQKRQNSGDVSPNTPESPGYGANGNFGTLNHILSNSLPFPIIGSYLTFYSPEISHQYQNSISDVISNNSCLLMVGRYGQYYSKLTNSTAGVLVEPTDNPYIDNLASYDIITSFNTNTTEGLGDKMDDHRRKMRTTAQVNKTDAIDSYLQYERGIEYVKQWKENSSITFHRNTLNDDDFNADLNESLGPYAGTDHLGNPVNYYFRNFYGYLGDPEVGLNYHFRNGTRHLSVFSKGSSGITGTMEKITNDPLTGSAVSISPANDYFASYVGSGLVSCIPEAGSPLNESSIDEANLTSTPMIDILIPRSEIYGGFSQDALEGNLFISASPIISKSNTNPIVYGGDVFINMWVFQESVGWLDRRFYAFNGSPTDEDFDENRTDTNCFAVESRINTDLSYGATIKTGVKYTAPGGSSGILAEQWRQETNNDETTFGKSFNMYLNTYNKAYSAESDDIIFSVKPSNFNTNCNINDIRAYISDVKINSEDIDSWTKFGINNVYDIDDYGPINEILNYKDTVFFYQDKAVGTYSINPRAIASTADGIPTELGSAEGFQDHTYISTRHGSIHQWAIIQTDMGIYSWDGIHKKIFKTSNNGNIPLSEVKGMHGFLKNLQGDISLRKENGGDNPIINKGVHITKDLINNEILFTFLGTWKPSILEINTLYSEGEIVIYLDNYYEITETYTSGSNIENLPIELFNNSISIRVLPDDKYTLVFDEIANQFSSRFSATPPMYIENGDILLSVNPNDRTNIYKHNSGNWGEFYDEKVECKISMILNSEQEFNKILRTIEFNSIVRDNNKNIDRTVTITSFRIQTEYQDTGKIDYSDNRIKRKWDKWRIKIPRDKTNNRNRLRSTYFILTLYFNNEINRELILKKILHYYNIQIY